MKKTEQATKAELKTFVRGVALRPKVLALVREYLKSIPRPPMSQQNIWWAWIKVQRGYFGTDINDYKLAELVQELKLL